jgi:hypothetical protein
MIVPDLPGLQPEDNSMDLEQDASEETTGKKRYVILKSL